MRPGIRDSLVITICPHIQPGTKQSVHLPELAHGVSSPSLTAFGGAAIFLVRETASWTSLTILFIPAIIITLSGPLQRHATLLPLPSIFTISPSIVIALELLNLPQLNPQDSKDNNFSLSYLRSLVFKFPPKILGNPYSYRCVQFTSIV